MAGSKREYFETKERIAKAKDSYTHILGLGFGRMVYVNAEQSVEKVTKAVKGWILNELHLT